MKHLMRNTIALYNQTTLDGFGQRTNSVSGNYKVRWFHRTKIIKGANGADKQSDADFIGPADLPVTIDARISYQGLNYEVIDLYKPQDDKSVKFIHAWVRQIHG